MKLPRPGMNFAKVVGGVVFSLVWGRVMYQIWAVPSYLTFVWFYLIVGSVVLKWILFSLMDKIYLKKRLRDLNRELEQADKRLREVGGRDEKAGSDEARKTCSNS